MRDDQRDFKAQQWARSHELTLGAGAGVGIVVYVAAKSARAFDNLPSTLRDQLWVFEEGRVDGGTSPLLMTAPNRRIAWLTLSALGQMLERAGLI